MDNECHGRTTTRLTQYEDGSCERTTTIAESGVPLSLVAKRQGRLFVDASGNLCTSGWHARRACRRLYVRLDRSEIRFTNLIGQATLLEAPNQWVPQLVGIIQSNCEQCARIEIGNHKKVLKIQLPARTAFQMASLKAKVLADKTGAFVPITSRRKQANPTRFLPAPRVE